MTAAYPIWSTLVGTLTICAAICVWAAFTYRTHSRRPDSLADHRGAVRGVYDQDQP